MVHISALSLVAGLFFGVLLFTPLPGSGQSKPTIKATISAAGANALLRNDLNWTFGGKPQRGWYIYTPLINRLINTRHDSASLQFASAVSRWQYKTGLRPGGILDEDTLYAMIKAWQEARLKDRSVASPDQLLIAPISDFYDPTRAEELRQVERKTYAAYKRMVAAAVAERSLGLGHNSRRELAPGEKYL